MLYYIILYYIILYYISNVLYDCRILCRIPQTVHKKINPKSFHSYSPPAKKSNVAIENPPCYE